MADMAILHYLNALICERLTAAAVEIFGEVEKTLTEYQGEISRSKQEIDHLKTLVLWPRVKLHRSAAHQVIAVCCDKEASPECCPSDVSLSTLHINEADHEGSPCRQQGDTTGSPQFVKREDVEEPASDFCVTLADEQTSDIKAEPDFDELITSPSTREAEIPCGINPESFGLQREALKDPLEITHGRDGLDGQQDTEQDWKPSQDHKDSDPPQIKEEKFPSSGPQEVTNRYYELPPQSESSYDEPNSSSPSHNQTRKSKTFYTLDKKRRDVEGEGCKLSGLTVPQPSYYFNLNKTAAQREYEENTEGVMNGEWIKTLTPTVTRQNKKHNSNRRSRIRDNIGVNEDMNDLTRDRRHTCPICAKRFKESSHLRDHVRIHTGEKPFLCKECGMNFRQRGTLTLHMRIHTGERPHQCSDCGRRFNRKGDLETHRMTHTGERPHLCVLCGKRFKRKSNLNTHLNIHSENKMDYIQQL
ncbi:zinc finger protein 613 isoform X2 [Etheostoma spectabile]|uniref:zinc finger protein 613 isoform X2 n=1 Tax=Etheostoma spectabile TaxID=54343 RepID=UPI0013AEF15D|nr:zinc finger protein 613-like isoform X2 [Etheostoma spectabile]